MCSAVLKSMKIVGSPYRESADIATDAIFASLEDNNSEGEEKRWEGEGRKAGEDSRAEKIQWERSGSRARARETPDSIPIYRITYTVSDI